MDADLMALAVRLALPGDEAERVLKGDFEGHPFRGNQYTEGVAVAASELKPRTTEQSVPARWDHPSHYQVEESFRQGEPVLGPNPRIVERVDNRGQQVLNMLAGQRGETPGMYEAKLTSHLQSLCDEASVYVRVPGVETLERILDSGRIKSQFETGTSEGMLNNTTRAEAEADGFQYPSDVDKSLRPVYGYLSSSALGDTGPENYGEIAIRFKDDVKERTTWTSGDSLGVMLAGDAYPVAVNHVEVKPLLAHMRTEMGIENVDDLLNFSTLDGGGFSEYCEAQIHGRVTLDDIDHVFLQYQPSEELRSKLEAAGISWTARQTPPPEIPKDWKPKGRIKEPRRA